MTIGEVDLSLVGPGTEDPVLRRMLAEFPVRPGDPAIHPTYETGKATLIDAAVGEGYLDASYTVRELRIDLERYTAEIALHLSTGPRYTFGAVRFEPDLLSAELLRTYLPFEAGAPLRNADLLALQESLRRSTYFGRVEVRPRRDLAQDLAVPIDVRLTPLPRISTAYGIGFGTDTGPRGSFELELRRINRRGHRAEAEARLSEVEQSAGAKYVVPRISDRPALLGLAAGFRAENPEVSDAETGFLRLSNSRLRGPLREVLSLGWELHDFEVGRDEGRVEQFVPGASWTWLVSDGELIPRRGFRLGLELQGASEDLLSDVSFFRVSLKGKLIRALGERFRFIGRAEAGYLSSSDFRRLPPPVRFFAGGDDSIRGFAYRTLGELDEDGEVIGAARLAVASAELEARVFGDFGAAAFVDVGSASAELGSDLERGAGLGLRWFSPLGVVRLDGAWALSRDREPFRIHLGVGVDL